MPTNVDPEPEQSPSTADSAPSQKTSLRIEIPKYSITGGALLWFGALVFAPHFDKWGLWWFLTGVGNGILVGWSLSLDPKVRPHSYKRSWRVPFVGVLCGGSTALSIFAAAGTEVAEKWSWFTSSTVLAMITCYAPFPVAWHLGRASSEHRRMPKKSLGNAMDDEWIAHVGVMVFLVFPIVTGGDIQQFGPQGGIAVVFLMLWAITHGFSFSIIATELERDLNWDEASLGRRSWFDKTPVS